MFITGFIVGLLVGGICILGREYELRKAYNDIVEKLANEILEKFETYEKEKKWII